MNQVCIFLFAVTLVTLDITGNVNLFYYYAFVGNKTFVELLLLKYFLQVVFTWKIFDTFCYKSSKELNYSYFIYILDSN